MVFADLEILPKKPLLRQPSVLALKILKKGVLAQNQKGVASVLAFSCDYARF